METPRPCPSTRGWRRGPSPRTRRGSSRAGNSPGEGKNPLWDLPGRLGEVLGVKPAPESRPPRAGDVRDSFADVSKARRLLGYAPTVDFREGLARTVEYYRRGGA